MPFDPTAAAATPVDAGSSGVALEVTTGTTVEQPLSSTSATVAVLPEDTTIVEVLPAASAVIEKPEPLSSAPPPVPVTIPEVPATALPSATGNQDATAVTSTKPAEVPTAPAAPTPTAPPTPPASVPAVSTGYSKQAVVESTRLAITHLETSSELPAIICEGPLYWANIILRDTAFQAVCHRHLANLLIHMSELIASNTDNIHILPIYDKNIRMTLQLCQLSYAPVQRYLPLDDKVIREVFPILILEVASAILTSKNTTTNTTSTTTTSVVPTVLKETTVQTLIGNLSREIDLIFSEESSSNTTTSTTTSTNSGEAVGGSGGGGAQFILNIVEKERRRQLVESVVTMCIQKLSL